MAKNPELEKIVIEKLYEKLKDDPNLRTLGDGEDIEVIKVPLEEIQHFLSNVEEGVLVDPKVFSVTENQELWEFAFVKS